jgi:hypothetical protein
LKRNLKILICTTVCAFALSGCVSTSKTETVIRSQKGYYPIGCKVCAPDGRTDEYTEPTYVLSVEAYRALMLSPL